jgi:hypothetical protein
MCAATGCHRAARQISIKARTTGMPGGGPLSLFHRSNNPRGRVILAIAALCLMAGCSRGPAGPGPEAAARNYLVALKSGDYQTCYRMLAEQDLLHGSLGEFLGQIPLAPTVEQRWFDQIEAATEYRLGPAEEQNETQATLPVQVTTPNLVVWERMLAAHSKDRKTLRQDAEKQLASGNFPVLKYADRMVLVYEDDEWRLVAGFPLRAQIDALHDQALTAYHQLDYAKALELYRQMLQRLDHARFTGRAGLAGGLRREMKRVEMVAASAAAAQAYIPSLKLKDVTVKPAMSGSQGMFGEIVNSGNRALDQINLTVSYYSPNGKLVYTERHTPFALPLRFADFELPLAPLAPGASRKFGIRLTAPTDVQQDDKPQLTVSGVIVSQPLESAATGGVSAGAEAKPK